MPEAESRFVQVSRRTRVHCLVMGDGAARPPVVLLHGFPECSFGWRRQMRPLAEAGFHVIAPDLRGYHRSDKPPRVADYAMPHLLDDVQAVIRATGRAKASVVGHDWGGIIAWRLAMDRPQLVDRLVVLNAPHPAAFRRELFRTSQWLRSWYVLFFQLPWLPEAMIRAGDFAAVRRVFRDDPAGPQVFSRDDIDRRVRALAAPRALTSALNYYRAAVRRGGPLFAEVRTIRHPTLLLWGLRDTALVPQLSERLKPWVPNLAVRRYPRNTHWLHHEAPGEVNDEIIRFLTPA